MIQKIRASSKNRKKNANKTPTNRALLAAKIGGKSTSNLPNAKKNVLRHNVTTAKKRNAIFLYFLVFSLLFIHFQIFFESFRRINTENGFLAGNNFCFFSSSVAKLIFISLKYQQTTHILSSGVRETRT